MNIFIIFRVFIGLLFIVSGGEKLISPYQNFLYVIESYAFLPLFFQEIVARVFPWIEFLTGIFLFIGLWTKQAILSAFLLFLGFIIVVFQAIMRQLPITECGCFGELMSFPLPVILAFDSTMIIVTYLLWKKFDRTVRLSLDQYFG